jgi:hypothetical protein
MQRFALNACQSAVLLAASVFCSVSHAQDSQGIHSNLLKKVLAESAKGNCSKEMMSPMLLGACQQQMPGLGNQLAQRGKIVGTEFMGMQQSGMGPAEVYRVNFESGSMMWMINTGPDGKILVLWSGG